MISSFDSHSVAVGKYRVASLSKCLDDGRYSASVSIRSGSGSASTDRVLRLPGRFDCEADARRHAHQQGLIWVMRVNPSAVAPQA